MVEVGRVPVHKHHSCGYHDRETVEKNDSINVHDLVLRYINLMPWRHSPIS